MSNQETGTWDERVARIWADAPNTPDDELLRKIETIAAERADDDPAALYELGSVHDSVGSEHDAEPYYRRALAGNLDRRRRPQAIIQLASTLRNLGQLEESAALLTAMSDAGPDPVVGDAGTAFLALVLIDLGREREAALRLARALTPHLPRYHRSMNAYLDTLEDPTERDT